MRTHECGVSVRCDGGRAFGKRLVTRDGVRQTVTDSLPADAETSPAVTLAISGWR